MPNKSHSQTWIIVADRCQAKIYRLVKYPQIEEISNFEHPESRLRDQDLVSDRPGRSFQRGGTTRHAYQSEHDPKQQEGVKFALELANHLSLAETKGDYNRLYIIAEPSFLGILRQHFTPNTQKTIVAEAAKDLTYFDKSAIESQLAAM